MILNGVQVSRGKIPADQATVFFGIVRLTNSKKEALNNRLRFVWYCIKLNQFTKSNADYSRYKIISSYTEILQSQKVDLQQKRLPI